jgi:hypothetical protein
LSLGGRELGILTSILIDRLGILYFVFESLVLISYYYVFRRKITRVISIILPWAAGIFNYLQLILVVSQR